MIIKGLSLITAAIILIVYQLSQLDSSGALFSFVSSSLPVNIGMVILAALMVRLSFMRQKFTRRTSYAAVAIGAFILGCFGAAGSIFPGVDYKLFSVIKPLDFFLFIEAAVIFGVCALTYEHRPLGIKVPVIIRLPAPAGLKARLEKRLAVWLPKPVMAHLHGLAKTRPA